MLNGVQFETLEDARDMQFQLRIEGSDQWIFDRLVARAASSWRCGPWRDRSDEFEEVETGWIEMARHKGDVR